MIYVNNLRARNRGTDDTLRKLYLYISCNNIYRVPRKKKRKERERHTALSSDSCTRSCSATAGPTKGTEHGAIQKGSVHSTVSIVSVTCLLCTTQWGGNCVGSQTSKFISFSRRPGNSKRPGLFQLDVKPVPILLEDQ